MLSMPLGSELTNLIPTITLSERARVMPASGDGQDFTNPIDYTVTAEDGTQRIYEVTVGIFPVVSYNPYEGNRLGAGDLYKEDLFTVSNIEPRNYNYKVTLGSYEREGVATAVGNDFDISIVDPNSTNNGSDQVVNSMNNESMPDGEVNLSISIDRMQYFNQTINKEQYSLKTSEDVQGIQHDLVGDYELMNDVDMIGLDFIPIGYDIDSSIGGHVGGKFNGSIEGRGYTISNVTITYDNRYIGFISYAEINSELNNIALINTNSNSISSNLYKGGLVGFNLGVITNSYITGNVSGRFYVGGLVGENRGDIENSYSEVVVGGGIVIGGLAGRNYRTIRNSYAIGSVSGDTVVGGLVGDNRGDIENSYAIGSVSAVVPSVGGLVGDNRTEGVITSSYWDIGISEQNISSGDGIGINPTEGTNTIRDDGDGTYSAMDDSNTNVDVFVDWKFGTDNSNPWVYLGDSQWPILYWQEEAQP